jgi:AraC-like DNA-binding protein
MGPGFENGFLLDASSGMNGCAMQKRKPSRQKPNARDQVAHSAPGQMKDALLSDLGGVLPAEEVFDDLPTVVFFVKDRMGRYVVVNQTLADRCGGGIKTALIGRMPSDIFPAELSARYQRQDQAVLRSGRPMVNRLELHLYKGRRPGWCITTKRPLRTQDGAVCGIIGLSRDVDAPAHKSPAYTELSETLDFIHEKFSEPLRISQLARRAGMSPHQFDLRVRRLIHLSPMQLIQKLRIDEAARLLDETDRPLAQIAADVGYCDQSALTRRFRSIVGLTPGQFRQRPR